jgi:small subunit ribosomal protein S12
LSTFSQLIKKNSFKKKAHARAAALNKRPQVRGAVKRARIVTPRKPNSARRPTAKIILTNKRWVVAHLPGVGHNIRPHSSVLVRGGGARDLPGVRFTCIRGVYDFASLDGKTRRRSIYGAKRPKDKIFKIRRKFRFK